MRKSLIELEEIDRYLCNRMPAKERLLFQACMHISPGLREKVRIQQQSHQMITWLGREDERWTLNRLHAKLMQQQAFREKISSVFGV